MKWLLPIVIVLGLAAGGFTLYELVYLTVPRRQDVFETDTQKLQVIGDMQNAIGQSLPTVNAVQLAVAWAAYESNWGSATAYVKANNPFNVAVGSSKAGWTGPSVSGRDTDDSTGISVPIVQQWRQYASLADGVSDCFNYILKNGTWTGNANLKNAWACLQQGDLSGFINYLHAGAYFTQDPSTYALGVQSCLDQIQSLQSQPDVSESV